MSMQSRTRSTSLKNPCYTSKRISREIISALLPKRCYHLPSPLLGDKSRLKPIWLLQNQIPAFPSRTKQVFYLPAFSFSKVMKIFITIKIKNNQKNPQPPPSKKNPKTQNQRNQLSNLNKNPKSYKLTEKKSNTMIIEGSIK